MEKRGESSFRQASHIQQFLVKSGRYFGLPASDHRQDMMLRRSLYQGVNTRGSEQIQQFGMNIED
jgi:hypothetical protein